MTSEEGSAPILNQLQLSVHENFGTWFGQSLLQNFLRRAAETRVRDSKNLA